MFRVLMFASALFVLSALPAQAASIGIITHDYGIGKHDPGGNDVLGIDWVIVSDQSSGRFNDVFDFSHLLYDSISHFELTLTYSDTDRSFVALPFVVPLEDWRVRPAASTTLVPLTRVGSTPTTNTFTFDNTLDVFPNFLNSNQFGLWFADETLFPADFRLYSASLEVFGEPTPASVPDVASTMLLFGVGLGFVAGASRLMRARQSARL